MELFSDSSVVQLLIVCLIVLFTYLFWRVLKAETTLADQLRLAFGSMVGISLALIVGGIIWQIQDTLTEQVGESLLALVTSTSQRLGVEVGREIDLLRSLSEDELFLTRIASTSGTELEALTPTERELLLEGREAGWSSGTNETLRSSILLNSLSNQLNNFQRNFSGHLQLIITDQYGSLVAARGEEVAHYYHGNLEWWRSLWETNSPNTVQVSRIEVMPGSLSTTVDLAFIIPAPLTAVSRGVLRSRFAIEELQLFTDVDPPGETGELLLIDHEGLVLFSSNEERIGSQLPPSEVRAMFDHPEEWREVLEEATGEELIRAQVPLLAPTSQPSLQQLEWLLILQQHKSEALATVNQLTQLALIAGLGVLLVVIFVGNFVARQLTRPIAGLTNVATAMADGELDRKAKLTGPQEHRTLARAFNSMTAQLHQTLNTLEERVAELGETNSNLTKEISQRLRVENELRQYQDHLEEMVLTRTAELESVNVKLEQDIINRKKAELMLQRRNQELAMVSQVSQLFSSSLDLDDVLETVLNATQTLLEITASTLWIRDRKTGELVCEHANGPVSSLILGWRLQPDQGIVGWVAAQGQSLLVPDVSVDERHFKEIDRQTGLPLRSSLSVPLKVKNDVIGVLNLVDTEVKRFSSSDVTLMESIASAASIAIENARLYTTAQQELKERKQAEKEVARSLSILQAALESTVEGILVVDTSGQTVIYNQKFADVWELPLDWYFDEQYTHRSRLLAERVVNSEEFLARIEMLYQNIEESSYDTLYLYSGKVLERYTAPYYMGKTVEGRVWSFRDVTQRMLSEKLLRDSEANLTALINNTENLIWSVDRDYKLITVNSATKELYQRFHEGEEQLKPGMSVLDILLPEFPSWEVYYERAFAGENLSIDWDYFFSEIGTRLVMEITFNPIWGEGDTVTGAALFAHNITERKIAEETIGRERMLLNSLINSIPDLIFYKDKDGVYMGCNTAFAELVERRKEEIVGLTDFNLFPPNVARVFGDDDDDQMLLDYQPRSSEGWVQYPNDRLVMLETLKTPYFDPEGELMGVIGISRNTTERKQMETELREAYQTVKTLNERLHNELSLARNIQHSLLPTARPEWADSFGSPDVICYSASAQEVGGDFYVHHALEGNLLVNQHPVAGGFGVAVGDVSGKGMPAALLMAVSLAWLQAVIDQSFPPSQLLSYLDQAIIPYTRTTHQNCAMVYLEITPRSATSRTVYTARVANAGCIMPLLRRAQPEQGPVTEWIEVGGLPLGVGLTLDMEMEYEEAQVDLEKGDLIVLTSDGVVEAKNEADEMFGFEQLQQAVAAGPLDSAEAMLNYLKQRVNSFVGNTEPHDDLTIVVVQV